MPQIRKPLGGHSSSIYPNFIKSGSLIKIKVLNGMRPATHVSKTDATNRDSTERDSKRHLEFKQFDVLDDMKSAYKSPMEIDIQDKEVCLREKEL